MQFPANNQKGRCGFCGKEVPVKDIRARQTPFCNRTCQSMGRYKTRYTGGGRNDVPNLVKKTKEL